MTCNTCYWTCFDYIRRLQRGGWGAEKPVTEALRKKPKLRQNAASCDARSMLLRVDPSRPFTKDYSTIGFVGQGSFGSVFEVRHRRTGETRVSKEILMRDIQDMKYAQTELEAMIRLDHPNVLKLYEYFEDNVAIYLICEKCNGGDFGQLLEPNIDIDEIRLLFRDVVAALSYCHNQGVVHRDMKSENCLIHLKPDRKVGKVIDFGLAGIKTETDNKSWLNEILGTRYYVAPEIIDKRIKYGFGCDVWAVGVMLYITVTDEHPCAANAFQLHTQELWKKIASKDPIRTRPLKNALVDPKLESLLKTGLLQKNPDKRCTAQQALDHEWFQFLSSGEASCRSRLLTPSATFRSSGPGEGSRSLRLSTPTAAKSLRGSQASMDSQESFEDEIACAQDSLKRAITYRQATHFEKAILTIASYQEASAEIDTLKDIFIGLDTAGNGTLSKQELAQGLQAAGIRMSQKELDGMFDALDTDRTGKVHFTEWLAGTIHPTEIASEKAVSDVFDFFDLDRTGRVNRDELLQVLGDEASAKSFLRAAGAEDRRYLSKADFARAMAEVAKSMKERQDRVARQAS